MQTKPKFDIISIGDAMIDTFFFIHDIEIKTIKGRRTALIEWATKLPIDEYYRTIGGNAGNNAVASARLGLKAAYYTIVGHDTGGRETVHKLHKEKVATDYVVMDQSHGTSNSEVMLFKGERTIFIYHQPRHYHLPKFTTSNWVYLTSLRDGFNKIYPDLARYLDRTKAKLGFNPGTFQLRAGPKANSSMLKRTELISVNKEEAQSWVGKINDVEQLCRRLAKLGPKAVALTDGRKGAYSYSREGFYYIPEFPGPRIEATGAGDSFTAAYIAALIYGKSHRDALRWGPVNAGSVVMKVGPIEGLLTKGQLTAHLSRMKHYQPFKITTLAEKKKIEHLVVKKKD